MRLPVEKCLPLAALTLLAACSGGGARPVSVAEVPTSGPAADYPMVLGPAFTVDGVTYTPVDKMNYDAVGFAGVGPDGGTSVSAAHRTLPLPSYIEVTALDTGKTILVRVERRGPMTGKNLVELSPGAAAQLGVVGRDKAAVRVRRVNPIEQDRAALRLGNAAPARMDTPKSLLAVLQRKLDQQEGVVVRDPAAEPVPSQPAVATSLPPKPDAKVKGAPKPPAVAVAPKPAPKPPLAAATAPKSTPKPQVASASPAPKPKPATPAAASAQKGKYFVQVGAFSSQANAEASAKKVGGGASQTGKLWRVRTGPYASEADAKAALAKAKGAGYKDARIQRAD